MYHMEEIIMSVSLGKKSIIFISTFGGPHSKIIISAPILIEKTLCQKLCLQGGYPVRKNICDLIRQKHPDGFVLTNTPSPTPLRHKLHIY